MPSVRLIFCVSLVLLGCGSEPPQSKEPAVGQVFPTLPLPPDPQLVSKSGSADALQITMRSSADVHEVADYYRTQLSRGKWRLVSDVKSSDGSTILYAEQNGPPLWVRIWKQGNQPGSMVQLSGAVVAKNTPPQKADTSGRRATPRS
jgi:hypothetical protein